MLSGWPSQAPSPKGNLWPDRALSRGSGSRPPPAVKPLGFAGADCVGHRAQSAAGTASSPGAPCPASALRLPRDGSEDFGLCSEPSPQVLPQAGPLSSAFLGNSSFPGHQRLSPASPLPRPGPRPPARVSQDPPARPGCVWGPRQLVLSVPRSVGSGTAVGLRVHLRCFGEPDVGPPSGLSISHESDPTHTIRTLS